MILIAFPLDNRQRYHTKTGLCHVACLNALITNNDRDTKLLPQNLSQPRSISQVDPFADTATLFVVHTLVCDSPIEAFWTSDG